MYPLVWIKVPTVFINIGRGFCDGLVFPVHPLGFHFAPKAFHGSVVPAVAFATHAADHTGIFYGMAVVIRAIS